MSSWSPVYFYRFSKWLKSRVLERDQWGILSRVYLCATIAVHCAVHGLVFLPTGRKLLQVSPFFSGQFSPELKFGLFR